MKNYTNVRLDLFTGGFWVPSNRWLMQAGGEHAGLAARSPDSIPLTQTGWHRGWVRPGLLSGSHLAHM